MKNKSFYRVLMPLFFIAFSINTTAQDLDDKNKVRIGVVVDGNSEVLQEMVDLLEKEIRALFKARGKVVIPKEKVLYSGWSLEKARENYNILLQDEKVDIIVSFGVLSGSIIASKDSFVKPVISWGIFDPVLQDLPITAKGKSGIHNLNFVITPYSLKEDIDVLYDIIQFKNIGFIFDNDYLAFMKIDDNTLGGSLIENGVTYEIISVDQNIDDVINAISDDIDVVYMALSERIPKDERARLINGINNLGIPSITPEASLAEEGVMMSTMPKTNNTKIIRRIALNIEQVIEGKDPAKLPVIVSYDSKLSLNMKTAFKVNFLPSWKFIAEADLINEDYIESNRVIGLDNAVEEALVSNLNIKIADFEVESGEKEVKIAKSNYYPTVNTSALGLIIDKETAENSSGQAAERSFTGTTTVQQLIFSEQACGGVKISKYLQQAVEQGRNQVALDVILNTTIAYFDVLRAKSNVKIKSNNLKLIKRNLEIAREREKIGYSGISDVYRWESELAISTKDLIESKALLASAKAALNQILNRPQDELYIVKDASLSDSLYAFYSISVMDKFVSTPKGIEVFTNFLVDEAMRNLPVLKQFDANLLAQDRFMLSNKRKRFMPEIALQAQTDYKLYKGGEGSEVEPVVIPVLGEINILNEPADVTWNVGLNISIPIYHGGVMSYEKQQSQIDYQRLLTQKDDLEKQLELRIRAKMLDLNSKTANLELSKKAEDVSLKNLELAQDAYSKGIINIVQLIDAQNAAIVAEQFAANSIYEYLTSIMELERYTGNFLLLGTVEAKQNFLNRLNVFFGENYNVINN